jgi:hypothetical protein
MHQSLFLAALAVSATSASPLATTISNPACAPVSLVVNVLHAYNSAASFCSSFLPITTKTAYVTSISTAATSITTTIVTGTSVVRGDPSTSTLSVQTVTASEITLTVTNDPTTTTLDLSTITADSSTTVSTA